MRDALLELLRDRDVSQTDEQLVEDILLTFQCEMEDLLFAVGALGVDVGVSANVSDEEAASTLGMGDKFTKWKAYSAAMRLRDKCQSF